MTSDVLLRRRGRRASAGRRTDGSAILWGICGVVIAVLIWQLIAAFVADRSHAAIPKIVGPLPVAGAILDYLHTDFLADLGSSLAVFFGGWVAGGVAATITGLLLGRVTLLRELFLPVVETVRPVSSIAWIPLSIVWFGLGYSGKVFIVGLAVYLVVIVYAIAGAGQVSHELERVSTMLGMGTLRTMRHLVLPSMLSEVVIGLRVSLMAGWGTVIIAELVAADTGMGNTLIVAQQSYDVPGVLASMLCFGAVGFLLNSLFTTLHRRLLRWQHDSAAGPHS